jgi:hypothetical protein
MYKPECFFHPGATYSAYYACTTYYDNGGVHLNSGVFNRLFAVLVDGGQYDQGDSVVVIAGLGISKTLNLYWKTHQELTAHAQFYDFAMAIKQVCSVNIGEPLYYPNVFNSTISEIDSLTSSDCELVSEAVAASGMDSTADVCPNIDCSGAKCEWAQCPAAEDGNYEVFHEVGVCWWCWRSAIRVCRRGVMCDLLADYVLLFLPVLCVLVCRITTITWETPVSAAPAAESSRPALTAAPAPM